MDKTMMATHSLSQNLYSKVICVRLTNSKCEEKFKNVRISVDYQTTTLPTHKVELIIKLTDEADPFFLYTLFMAEEDYQSLKSQQGLLVDFGAFGQKFIDLLNLCEKDVGCESPKFQLQFYTKEPLPFDKGNGSLNVIEINPFKHLCHLQLQFMPGNDGEVKKYLANRLETLREHLSRLQREHDETKMSLGQRLENTQAMLAAKCSELDKLKLESDTQAERISTKYMQELNFEKEKALQNQYATQQKYEKEKKELETSLSKMNKQMESRLIELEAANKELVDKKYKNEAQLQELRSKCHTLQEEYSAMKTELAALRKQNTGLDSELHTNEKTVNHLRTRIAVLEQEVKDKDELVQRSQDLLANEQAQKKTHEEMINEKNVEIKKLQASVKHISQELMKGNEIISKLQTRIRESDGKLKLKNEILKQQEKVIAEKDKELAQIGAEFKSARDNLATLGDENKELKTSLAKKSQELEEAAKIIKKDENIINWLNKQINDMNMNGGVGVVAQPQQQQQQQAYGNQFKPFGTLSAGAASGSSGSVVTPRGLDAMSNVPNLHNAALLRSTSVNATAMSSGSSSNLIMAAQPAPINRVASIGGSSANSSSSQNRGLDPKYFQSQSPIEGSKVVKMSSANATATSIDTSKMTLSSNMSSVSAANAVRISKPLSNISPNSQLQLSNGATVNPYSNGSSTAISTKSTPSLASAYFPTN